MIAILTCEYAAARHGNVTTKIVDSSGSGWLNSAVSRRSGSMHVDQAGRHYTTVGGERRAYPTYLLRRSFRDEDGRPRKETLANLTGLPEESIAALRATLKGRVLVDAGAAFEVERSVPHGDVAAAHVMASKLGLRALLGPACRERDIAYALIISRAVRPESKLSTARWWADGDTTLGTDLGVAGASTDEVYAAMDWLVSRQRGIEKQLAARHLAEGGIAMFDLSSSWVEGSRCELAAFGYSRDGKRGREQVEYGLLTDPAGRPVAVEVFPGNTSDPESFKTAITRVRADFGIERLICCHNPVLATERARKRENLLAATENDLAKIKASVDAGRLKDADKIGIRIGKVIGKHKVAKHFITEVTGTAFTWRRDQDKIAAEAALDGIYVIRTSVDGGILGSAEVVAAYKNLKHAGRDFRITKADDLDLRPIYHYPASPVAPARRSAQARAKDAGKHTSSGLPVRKYQDLLGHLATLARQTINFSGQPIEKLTSPTPIQRRAFELLGAPVPLALK